MWDWIVTKLRMWNANRTMNLHLEFQTLPRGFFLLKQKSQVVTITVLTVGTKGRVSGWRHSREGIHLACGWLSFDPWPLTYGYQEWSWEESQGSNPWAWQDPHLVKISKTKPSKNKNKIEEEEMIVLSRQSCHPSVAATVTPPSQLSQTFPITDPNSILQKTSLWRWRVHRPVVCLQGEEESLATSNSSSLFSTALQ